MTKPRPARPVFEVTFLKCNILRTRCPFDGGQDSRINQVAKVPAAEPGAGFRQRINDVLPIAHKAHGPEKNPKECAVRRLVWLRDFNLFREPA